MTARSYFKFEKAGVQEVSMPFDDAALEAIARRFSSALYWVYGKAQERWNQERHPRWLKTYLAFCALEAVRVHLQVQQKYLYCRFSLGRRGPNDEQELDQGLWGIRIHNE